MSSIETLREAFLSPDADDLFTSVAAFADATEIVELDVQEGQVAARRALEAAIANAGRRRASEGTRIALIRGAAGSGKTHLLAATLRKAAANPAMDVLPAVLQLTAPVRVADYENWLVDAVFRELGARHFPNGEGHSPLRRLADRLLNRVSDEDRDAFVHFVDDEDDDGEIVLARDLGTRIRRQGHSFLHESPPPAAFLAALLLAGYGDESAVTYLRHGQCDDRTAVLGLRPVETPQDRFALLQSLSLAVELAGSTLVLAFDQVENIVRLGSEDLFLHTLTQAVRVVHDMRSVAVPLVVLKDAYDRMVSGEGPVGLAAADRDRIERDGIRVVDLPKPTPELLSDILRRRLAVLRSRRGLEEDMGGPFAPLPDTLLDQVRGEDSTRRALLRVSDFRSDVMDKGWDVSPTPDHHRSTTDYDKDWADFHDAGPRAEIRLLVSKKAELLRWWAEEAGRELAAPYGVKASAKTFGSETTHVVDLELTKSEISIERRQLALCDAKNQRGYLRMQIEAFLEWSVGIPAIYRDKGFPKGSKTQVASALADLRAQQGLILEVEPSEWNSLHRAKEFFDVHHHEPDFLRWRRERRWLHQLVSPLGVLIAVPTASKRLSEDTLARSNSSAVQTAVQKASSPVESNQTTVSNSAKKVELTDKAFPVYIGQSRVGSGSSEIVVWDPYRSAPGQLNNFSFLITGDPGAGKTQTIRVLIDAACRADLPVMIFDFKADYGNPDFTQSLGLETVDVRRRGLPFNPLKPPPAGASGAQPAEHAYELAGLLRRVLRMGEVQEGKLRDAIHRAYVSRGIEPKEWIDPESVTWPTFDAVLEQLRGDTQAANIVTRLAPLVDLGLFPSHDVGDGFGDLLRKKVVLSLNELPTDELKALLAEILIIQIHGNALRGQQPRRLARLIVFDEAHRVAGSRRLEALGREGRAFGIGVVVGTQFPGDIPEDLAGTMATNLFLMNSQADHRRAVVRQVYGTTSSSDARGLADDLAALKPLEGLFSNAHYRPVLVTVTPHHARRRTESRSSEKAPEVRPS